VTLRETLRLLFKPVIALYFREIEVVGQVPVADTRGRIFGANHTNGIVDPVLVLTQVPCVISPIAKSTLWDIPGLRWLLDAADAVPIVRRRDDPGKNAAQNDEVFDRIAAHLSVGGNVLIFPEGTSHNEPHLLDLRSGAGRMLARAKGTADAKGLTFQAVGLEFDARTVFRSRALLVFGPVRDVDAIGKSGDALAAAITDRLKLDLSELLVEGPTWEERLLVARVAEMFANHAGDRTLAGWNEVGRRVEDARAALSPGDALYERVRTEVGAYYKELDASGLGDDQLTLGGGFTLKPARLARAIVLMLALPLAVVGVVLYWLPYQLPRLVVRFLRGSDDVVSTYKLGTGLLVFPLFAVIYAGVALALLPVPFAALATVASVLSAFAALAWSDRSARLHGSIKLLTSRARIDELRARRVEVMKLLTEARARLAA
jgi:glycerol-3-phosphate O-acyltransferase / dihydroxyacetone phosphate acyltransferase